MRVVFTNERNIVSNILDIEEQDIPMYVEWFEGLTLWEGEIPSNVSYQFKIEGDKLVYDPEIEDVQGEIAEPEPDPRDAKIAQMEADLDYYEMVVEAQEGTLARQQADIDYVLMITEG
ncbi:MAG: hypothetical protein ACRCXB_17830 [Aeromonadaceae bacterium]